MSVRIGWPNLRWANTVLCCLSWASFGTKFFFRPLRLQFCGQSSNTLPARRLQFPVLVLRPSGNANDCARPGRKASGNLFPQNRDLIPVSRTRRVLKSRPSLLGPLTKSMVISRGEAKASPIAFAGNLVENKRFGAFPGSIFRWFPSNCQGIRFPFSGSKGVRVAKD